MVRVVSCHHFVSQDVFLTENEPTAFCSAQGKFLVATTQHNVNVHNLDCRGSVLHTFSTVDLVKQITYCDSGNYVATIESKSTWHGSPVTYVRVYFKWWIDVNGQPLKVRVASSAPSALSEQSWSNQFEMIEIPLEEAALHISCCKKTSSLAVSLGKIISVFCYSMKTFDSHKEYPDFDHFIDIHMNFIVQELVISEYYFACMSERIIQVFKIMCEKDDESLNKMVKTITQETENSDLYDKHFVEWKFESCTEDGARDTEWEEHLKLRLHPKSFPLTLHLPTIDKENEDFSADEECEIHGPRLTIKGCALNLRLDSKVFEMFPLISCSFIAVTLLFKQFSAANQKALKGLQLISFHEPENMKEGCTDPLSAAANASNKHLFSMPWPNMMSTEVSNLKAIGCFFSTSQEGYLYDITGKVRILSTYSYTSTLKEVILEPTLLHALTETGLETYTVHLAHSIFAQLENVDGIKNIVPDFNDPVCLIGLRPFLGVDHLVMSDNHIVLVSSMEDSVANTESNDANNCTLYSLKKPLPVQVFTDLLEVAESHRSSSCMTYYNLLSEGHMILRTELLFHKYEDKQMGSLYKNSCLLLADFFIWSDTGSKANAAPYYHLSKVNPEKVVQRILDFKQQLKHSNILKPLICYLNTVVLDDSAECKQTFQPIADQILMAYSEEAPELLWNILLHSPLSGYKIDKAILMLKRRLTSKRHPLSPFDNAADTTALVNLLLQKGSADAAQNMLLSLAKADLVSVLTKKGNILWKSSLLTNLGKFIKQIRPDACVELLLHSVDHKSLNVSEVLQILQNDAPSSEFHCVPLLKEFLEASLSDKKILSEVDPIILNLLVKIYLKRLLEPRGKCVTSISSTFVGSVCSFTLLFGSRPTWLNDMPPFNGNGISRTCLFSKTDSTVENQDTNLLCCCWTCNEDLLRLQSLLAFLGPLDDVKELVLECVHNTEEKKITWLSLEVMCSNETQAVKILIGMAPIALLPYAKENFKTDEKKWCMLFTLLCEHMRTLFDDDSQLETYKEVFHGVLNHLAETLKPVDLLQLLPSGDQSTFLPHVKRCVEKHQAEQLKDKIVSLGQEIKSMM